MAAGLDYTGNEILGDYPCDIQSIVRYRGGFNMATELTTNFEGYKFPIFTPLYVNFDLREVGIVDTPFTMPSNWDSTFELIIYAFSYTAFTMVEGLSLTVVSHADEISWSGLNALRYYDISSTDGKEFETYKNLLTNSTERTTLMTNLKMSHNTFVW